MCSRLEHAWIAETLISFLRGSPEVVVDTIIRYLSHLYVRLRVINDTVD